MLAAGILAAFSSALLAQSQPPRYANYDGSTRAYPRNAPASIPACDSNSRASADNVLDYAVAAMNAKAMPTAICWLKVAAADGIALGYGGLAVIYYKGSGGIPVDLGQALYYANKAAEGRDADGESILSMMYETGQGVPKDADLAKYWKDRSEKDEAVEGMNYARARQAAKEQAPTLPSEMRFCGQHCLTFTRQPDGTYVNRDLLAGQRNVKRVMTIRKFTPESVMIDRVDTGDFPLRAPFNAPMDPGNESMHGSNWKIAWGSAIGTLPTNDPGAQPVMQANPLMMLLSLFLGSGADDAGGGGDIISRISSLESQVASATDKCNAAPIRGYSNQAYCDREEDLKSELASAHADLITEIQELRQEHDELSAACGKGDKESCDKQKQVDAQLARDRQF